MNGKLVASPQKMGNEFYGKTEMGKHLHKLLKGHEYVGSLFEEELVRDRRA
jgi:hypothetical protein